MKIFQRKKKKDIQKKETKVNGNKQIVIAEKTASFDQLVMIAGKLYNSGLFTHLRKPEQAVAVIEYGRELEVPPMQSLQMMAVIKGKIAIQSQLLLAIVKRNGCDIEITKQDKEKCEIKFKRDGKVYPVRFTFDEAKDLKLTDKDNWLQQPANMLFWRCISKAIRRHAPDLMLGIYTIEEMTAGDKTTVKEIQEDTDYQPAEETNTQKLKEKTAPKKSGDMTEKQREYIDKIKESHLLNDKEKKQLADMTTFQDASDFLGNWWDEKGDDGKAGERTKREYIEAYLKAYMKQEGKTSLSANFKKIKYQEARSKMEGLTASQVKVLIKELKQ